MPSPKDYEVTTYLSESAYNDFKQLAELKGMSHSGMIRSLIIQAVAASREEFYQCQLLRRNQ